MIVMDPDVRLRSWCRPVNRFDEKIRDHIKYMWESIANPCTDDGMLGVAANQLGFTERFFLFFNPGTGANDIAINPRLLNDWGPFEPKIEGCLSIPGKEFIVPRPSIIEVSYFSYTENINVTRKLEGLIAQIFCHEIDHLDGKLIRDYADRQSVR